MFQMQGPVCGSMPTPGRLFMKQELKPIDWRAAEEALRRVACGLPSTNKEKPASEAGEKRGRVFRPWFKKSGEIIVVGDQQ
jgi:hypothetical protein